MMLLVPHTDGLKYTMIMVVIFGVIWIVLNWSLSQQKTHWKI